MPMSGSATVREAEAGCHRAACRGCRSVEGGGGLSSPEEPPPAMGMTLRLSMMAQQKSPETQLKLISVIIIFTIMHLEISLYAGI